MFKWLKKIFNMEKQNENQTPEEAVNQDIWPNGREFLIEVYDLSIDDSTGKVIPQRVSYEKPVTIKAFSKAELNGKLALYRKCDQMAKIVQEVTPVGRTMTQNSNSAPIQHQPVNQQTKTASSQVQKASSNTSSTEQTISPQYFKIGDIEIKIENGKSFQKQFVTLTETEAKNIRIVDDKTNRVLNLKGKHIEMKKWIQVQSTSTDEVDSLEKNITETT